MPWSSGWCPLVTSRLRFDSPCGSFASNLEQVASLLCAQVNLASYPQRDGKWVVAYGLRGEGLVWLIGAVVCPLAALQSKCSLVQAMDGRIVRHDIISSCQSAATSDIVKSWLQVWLVRLFRPEYLYFYHTEFERSTANASNRHIIECCLPDEQNASTQCWYKMMKNPPAFDSILHNQSINQSINQPLFTCCTTVNMCTSWSINQSINEQINQSVNPGSLKWPQ